MYGVLGPSWQQLSKEQRLDFLQAVYKAAQERGCTQVNLITKDGKNAAFASATRMDIE
jgi:hypothetical protein